MSRNVLVGIILCLALYTSTLFIQRETFDLGRLWKSGELILKGENPFNLPLSYTYNNDFFFTTTKEPAFFWPPFWLFPFVFFSFFTYTVAKQLFTFCQIAVIVWSTFEAMNLFPLNRKLNESTLFTLVLIATAIPLGGIVNGIYWSSPSWLILLGIMGTLKFIEHKKYDWITGAFMYLIGIKIQIGLTLIILISIWALRNKRNTILYSFFTVLFVGTGWLIFLYPDLFHEYHKVLSDTDLGRFTTASIISALRTMYPSEVSRWMLFVPFYLVFIASIIVGVTKVKSVANLRESICLFIPISLAFAPYAWAHDSMILLPSLFWVVQIVNKLQKERTWLDLLPITASMIIGAEYSIVIAALYICPTYQFTPYLITSLIAVCIAANRSRILGQGAALRND